MNPNDETLDSEEPEVVIIERKVVDFFLDNYDDSYEEFLERVYASYEHPANQKRLGQVFFNKLHKERPDVAAKIQGTMFDPFYKEHLHPKVSDRVRSLWYGEEDE